MDVAKAFTFVTEDERWIGKIGIGAAIALLSVLIIPFPLLVGYLVGITRNVRDGVERPLPEWDDFGLLFKDGLAVIVAQLVYTLPFWLITCIAIIATIGFSSMSGTNEDLSAVGISITWIVVSCVSLLFAAVLFFLSPAIVLQYVATDDLGSLFRFSEVAAIARDNLADILIAALATLAGSLILNIVVGGIAFIPCLGWVAAPILGLAGYPWLTAITGHLYGQIAVKSADGKAKLAL